MNPEISVVMSVYNGEKYLRECIDSILKQSFKNFEFIIVNDGSTDKTNEIIKTFRDSRIVYIENESNQKLIFSLNKGLALARGKYIARMDADDVALPERFAIQYDFLKKNVDVAVCDSGFIVFDEQRSRSISRYMTSAQLKVNLIFGNPIRHSAILMRKSILDKYGFKYDHNYVHAEDHHFWARIACVGNITILPDVLMKCRSHRESIRETHSAKMLQSSNKAKKFLLREMHSDFTDEELDFHCSIFSDNYCNLEHRAMLTEKWFVKLLKINKRSKFFHQQILEKELKNKFLIIFNSQFNYNWFSIYKYLSSELHDLDPKNWNTLIKLFIKSITFRKTIIEKHTEVKDKWFN